MNKKILAGVILIAGAGFGLFRLGSYIVDKKAERDYAYFIDQPIQLSSKRNPIEQIRATLDSSLSQEQAMDLLHSRETAQTLDLIWNELARSPQASPQLAEDLLSLPYLFDKVAFFARRIEHARTVDKEGIKEFVAAVDDASEKLGDVRATSAWTGANATVALDRAHAVYPDELFEQLAHVLETYKNAASAASTLAARATPIVALDATQKTTASDLEKNMLAAQEQLVRNEREIVKELDRLAALGRHDQGRSDREADALRILAQQGIRSLAYAYTLSNPFGGKDLVMSAGHGFADSFRLVRGLTDVNSAIWTKTAHEKDLEQILSPIVSLLVAPLDKFTVAVLPDINEVAKVAAGTDVVAQALSGEDPIILWRVGTSALPAARFNDPVDAFQFLNSLSVAPSSNQRRTMLSANAPVALGQPKVINVRKTGDGGFDFHIASATSKFQLAAHIPPAAETSALSTEDIEHSKPAVAFVLRDSALYLTGVALELDKSAAQNFIGMTNIRIPVAFTEQSATAWKAAYAAKQAAEQEAADKADQAAEQEAMKNQKQIEQQRERDPIYRYAQGLASGMRQLPACQMIAQRLLDIASSNAPAVVRERQVEAMFNHVPEICVH